MRLTLLAMSLLLLFPLDLMAQQKKREPVKIVGDSTYFTIGKAKLHGKVTEEGSELPLQDVSIFVTQTNTGTATDDKGNYVLPLNPGIYTLRFQYLGYNTVVKKIHIYSDGDLNITLSQKAYDLNQVIVQGTMNNENLKSAAIGVEKISVARMKDMPTLLGVPDVVNTLLLLPGVNTVGEGSLGFNVRGGTTDQNLVLLDGAPLLNSSHALGLFSVFNPDLTQDFTLYKGNIPARYGGRLSSVLDVNMSKPNTNHIEAKGGIGLASGRLSVNGPITKAGTGLLLGVRSIYSDWMLNLVKNEDIKNSSVGFYDALGELTQRINNNNRLALIFYGSYDKFRYSDQFGYSWGTKLVNFKWNKAFSPNFLTEFSAAYGDYSSTNFDPAGFDAFNLSNGMKYYQLREDLLYKAGSSNLFNGGLEFRNYQGKPEIETPYFAASTVVKQEVQKGRGRTFSAYLSDDINIGSKILLSLGIRYSRYQQLGPDTVLSYQQGVARSSSSVTGSTIYGKNKIVTTFHGLDPRASLRYSLSDASSVKLSFNRLHQYIHLISNSISPTPADIWQVSNPYEPAESSDNYSAGYYRNFANQTWETSLELYYKKMSNLVVYKNFAELHLNSHMETELSTGTGKAYGAEFTIKKVKGKWTGWLAYTYSRSFLKTGPTFPDFEINHGNWFPSNYDEPNNITMAVRRRLGKKSAFSVNFTYRTGRPFTAINSNYEDIGTTIPVYSTRNDYRIPAYIRLDVGFTIADNIWKNRHPNPNRLYHDNLTISFYNLLGRKNAFSIFYKRPPNVYIPEAYKLSVLGSIIPAITYNFRF